MLEKIKNLKRLELILMRKENTETRGKNEPPPPPESHVEAGILIETLELVLTPKIKKKGMQNKLIISVGLVSYLEFNQDKYGRYEAEYEGCLYTLFIEHGKYKMYCSDSSNKKSFRVADYEIQIHDGN